MADIDYSNPANLKVSRSAYKSRATDEGFWERTFDLNYGYWLLAQVPDWCCSECGRNLGAVGMFDLSTCRYKHLPDKDRADNPVIGPDYNGISLEVGNGTKRYSQEFGVIAITLSGELLEYDLRMVLTAEQVRELIAALQDKLADLEVEQ